MSQQEIEIVKAWGCSSKEQYLEALAEWLELPKAASHQAANDNHHLEQESAA